jgi:hypothetical protein
VPAPFYRFQTSTSVIARCFLHVYHDAGHWRANVQNITTPRLTVCVITMVSNFSHPSSVEPMDLPAPVAKMLDSIPSEYHLPLVVVVSD